MFSKKKESKFGDFNLWGAKSLMLSTKFYEIKIRDFYFCF